MPMISEAALLHGIDVTLYEKTKIGEDPFEKDIFTETPVTVENVLVSPASEQEILDTLQLHGRKAIYTLSIPKDDTHDWTDVRVSFRGQTFKTIGAAVQSIDELTPLDWNKKVRCEEINGKSKD